jgi:cytochrome c oxidase subunit 3
MSSNAELELTQNEMQEVEASHHEHTEHVHRDDFASKMGMWLFLLTELLLFGGLFILYMAYRFQYSHDFHIAAKELNVGVGTLNTIILLTSSLSMALSIIALQKGKKNLSINLLWSTVGLAGFFMVNKFFEWSAKFAHGLYPGSAHLLEKEKGEIIFYGMYFTMTGLHGLHVLIGMALILVVIYRIKSGTINADKYIVMENSGLYWHLVDLIWIFLFPLFYLIH